MRIFLNLFVLLFLFWSCAHQRVQVTEKIGQVYASEEKTQHFFFWGFAQIELINASPICAPKAVSTIETSTEIWQGLVTVATLGIYAPRKIKIYCAD